MNLPSWLTIALAVVVALDTSLAAIPQIKANSTFQLISKIIQMIAGGDSASK